MKIPKEYIFFTIGGLLLLAYVLEAVVDPFAIKISSPYRFFSPDIFLTYPFTAAIIVIRGLAIFLTPLLIFSFFDKAYFAKSLILLILGGLLQLYSLQEIATGTTLAPIEWSLSLTLGGALCLLTIVIYLVLGIIGSAVNRINDLGPIDNNSSDDDH